MISKEDIRRWGGKDVFDPAGEKIGTIEDFYLDKDTYDPDWLIVKKGLLGAGSKLIPFIAIDWRDDHVVACYEKDMVDDSPGPGMDGRLSDEEEYDLMEHYGLARSVKTGRMVGTMGHQDELGTGPTGRERIDDMDQDERRRLAQQAAAAHPFSTGLEEEDQERAHYDERTRMAAAAAQAERAAEQPAPAPTAAESGAPSPEATEQRGSEAMKGEEVAGSTRLVRVKKYMVTERVEQVPLSEEEFEEGDESSEHRRAA